MPPMHHVDNPRISAKTVILCRFSTHTSITRCSCAPGARSLRMTTNGAAHVGYHPFSPLQNSCCSLTLAWSLVASREHRRAYCRDLESAASSSRPCLAKGEAPLRATSSSAIPQRYWPRLGERMPCHPCRQYPQYRARSRSPGPPASACALARCSARPQELSPAAAAARSPPPAAAERCGFAAARLSPPRGERAPPPPAGAALEQWRRRIAPRSRVPTRARALTPAARQHDVQSA
mmetsp:Transcript_2433/g.5125  ORF Transcript_2433/g.5125 Transcript_2433/m.5125 type:complete len:235 (-) Transcript_2433:231-935(-)